MAPPSVHGPGSRRRCRSCEARLASDNNGDLCSPCQERGRGADDGRRPLSVPPDFWQHSAMQTALATRHMGRVIRAYREHPHHGRRGPSQEDVAAWSNHTQGWISQLETGPPINQLDRLVFWAQLLGIPQDHLWFSLPEATSGGAGVTTAATPSARPSGRLLVEEPPTRASPVLPAASVPVLVEAVGWACQAPPSASGVREAFVGLEAIELLRQAEATDIGSGTLAAVADGIDGLCRAFTSTSPAELLSSLHAYQRYLARLLGGRATLAQRRDLLDQAGWLSLLTATASMDIGLAGAAESNLAAAAGLAREVGDHSLAAWVLETRAWQALSNGDHDKAAGFCGAGLDIARPATSEHVQLCTQAARVAARRHDRKETYRRVDEAVAAVDGVVRRESPAHHFVSDPDRVLSFCAAALVWLDDDHVLAEEYARRAVTRFDSGDAEPARPHEQATSRMNLALLLARHGEPEEATHLGHLALERSWRLCHTDLFLADDLDRALVGRYGASQPVTELHERYVSVRGAIEAVEVDDLPALAELPGGPAAQTSRS